MKETKKKKYIQPECYLCNARVERGFAGSASSVQCDHGNIEGWDSDDAIFF